MKRDSSMENHIYHLILKFGMSYTEDLNLINLYIIGLTNYILNPNRFLYFLI